MMPFDIWISYMCLAKLCINMIVYHHNLTYKAKLVNASRQISCFVLGVIGSWLVPLVQSCQVESQWPVVSKLSWVYLRSGVVHKGRSLIYRDTKFHELFHSTSFSSFNTAMNASWGTSTLPIAFILFFPSACLQISSDRIIRSQRDSGLLLVIHCVLWKLKSIICQYNHSTTYVLYTKWYFQSSFFGQTAFFF